MMAGDHVWNFSYASTFENSGVGDMMKLSLLLDHDMRFCILGSSSMLIQCQRASHDSRNLRPHLYNLCMNAVCTTLGCCDCVAAAALNVL